MKSVIAVVMMAGVALAAPGGYTGLGGVYKELNQDADYIHLAKNAAKMQIDLFQDESLTTDEEVRPARKAVYVPTFFTSVPQESVPSQVAVQATRFSRNANTAQVYLITCNGILLTFDFQRYELPIFYNEYRPKTLHIAY